MENKKKTYEEPAVTKVEFDFNDRITAKTCELNPGGKWNNQS